MQFENIYNNFKLNIYKILNAKNNDEFILPEKTRQAIVEHINKTELEFKASTIELDKKISKLETSIYIENISLDEKMVNNKQKYHEDKVAILQNRDKELNDLFIDFNSSINEIYKQKKDYENFINKEIDNINQAIKYERVAYESNINYYDNLITKALKRYDDYNTIIYNKIVNIDLNQPKTPKFNAQRKKFSRVINNFKNAKGNKIGNEDIADGYEFISVMNEYPNALDDIITSLEEHSLFQTRIDNLNLYLEKLNNDFITDKNKIEKIKHEVSSEYNKKLHTTNESYNYDVNSNKINNERKIKSIDKRVERQKKEYQDESAHISEDYVSHITNISNEINNLDKENKRLIDNYNREYYFTYYKTLFEYNKLQASIKEKIGYNNDQKNKYEQKRLDNFELKAYQQKLKSLKLKHDKYVEQLNLNIIQQINHNNYEITESNLYKSFDLSTSKIKHESFLKKSKLLKDNIEKTSSFNYAICSLKHDKNIINLRFNDYDNKRQELDYEIDKMEIEHIARRTKIEKKIQKLTRLKDEYIKFVENDNALIKTINDSNHNTKLSVYYFEIRKNNLLKEYNKAILELAKSRANIIKEHKIKVYNLKIRQLNDNLAYYLETCDYKIKYYTDKYHIKQTYINEKYDINLNLNKNDYLNKKNIKAIIFERNTFRHDNLKSRHYSEYVFNIYYYTCLLHMTLASFLESDYILISNLNKVFINFYCDIVKTYYVNEQNNLEERLNEIYYYKNNLQIKKLNTEKKNIINEYDVKISNLKYKNSIYNNNLDLFINEPDKIKIKANKVNKVKRDLIKSIKLNNQEITNLETEKQDKLNKINSIIEKNKRSSIIHYQNYHTFKKSMAKEYNSVIKNINNIEHKTKKHGIMNVLEQHLKYVDSLKLDVYRLFKDFTTNVENEFPRESRRTSNNYLHSKKVQTERLNRILNIKNININKLSNELKHNLIIPKHKLKKNTSDYIHVVKLLEFRHKKIMFAYKHKIYKLQQRLVVNELKNSTLISNIQTNNQKLVKRTKEKQQDSTTKYIYTISYIRNDYLNDIILADRNKITALNELKHKYEDINHDLKTDKNNQINKCNKEIKLNEYKQKEIQRIYKRNSNNIDIDLINDRVDQQIILSQKLKKLKRLFMNNKDLSSLEDNDYTFVTLNSYDDINKKNE